MPRIDPTPNPNPRDDGEELSAGQPVPPPIVISYTRAQAVADGVMIDVTTTAKEAGFVLPVAVTAAVWAEYIKVPDGVEAQDEAERLWDVLSMLRFAIRRDTGGGPELLFQLHVRNENSDGDPGVVQKATAVAYDDLREEVAALSAGGDPLLARLGGTIGVVSHVDALLVLRGAALIERRMIKKANGQ